ncbi:hypothetical protein Deipe_2294 [Deinococcus peraridilitoris DSM 19664]|uniref:DUF3553 domain-containing protein n=1 Tax=Deinococcus peraridilitoris (strain DSM 19664 / LMG 22246 / CIP 109416 / KR-200) TaxID=937777 RepID=L0A419_DEIPD|nr:hypothetical protein Deipe_2294 [Deinococcus peraridilitoris DSM 19664]
MTSEKASPPDARRYRWLVEGQLYRYGPKSGKGDEARRGELCQVVTLPRPGSRPANVRVQFADGHLAIVPSGVLRLLPKPTTG